MKKKILIIKNKTSEGPGLLEKVIREKEIPFEIIDLEMRQSLPQGLNGIGAVVILGGPDSANDQNEKMKTEISFIREALAKHIPYLGICLGMQTLVKAAGGKVVRNPVKETGFRDPENEFFRVFLTDDGKNDPLFVSLNDNLPVFHLHGETVELPERMKLLAEGKFCKYQVVKAGEKAYGIQCHFELTPEMFAEWIHTDPDLLLLDSMQLQKDFAFLKDEYLKTGEILISNFMKIAGY